MMHSEMRRLPDGVTPGRRTPTFDAASVPTALLDHHLTTAWAELVVVAGAVRFVEESGFEATVAGGERLVLLPGRRHRVEPDAEASFFVQFYVEVS